MKSRRTVNTSRVWVEMRELIVYILVFYLYCYSCGVQARGGSGDFISRPDFSTSFAVPDGLEHVEVENAIVVGGDLCCIAFDYTDRSDGKAIGSTVAMPEDWRSQTDFVLDVRTPLSIELDRIRSTGGAPQKGTYRPIAHERLTLTGGELHIFVYQASRPTAAMIRLNQLTKVIFIAGDDDHTVSFYLYSAAKNISCVRQDVQKPGVGGFS
ncbi:hypothetical protein AWB72_05656 [Caballeronia concitans]|uniref:Uncharacterized protein n=2 Tax=Caballeronia concitans TaxID=1777133 RepID=A0A658R608_9BURK|nr:hypothetical protein AWB72_05656 [Caballeronia concitans]